ncbi:hypothetical protein C9J85_05145 [Haloferax sp. wsp5]|nr:hypothetical protein C9J85_05145 [Haloferax sp. wsp5]
MTLWDQNDQESLSEVYTKIFQVLSILLLPAGVGLALLADDIILLTINCLFAIQSDSLVPILLIGFIIKDFGTR